MMLCTCMYHVHGYHPAMHFRTAPGSVSQDHQRYGGDRPRLNHHLSFLKSHKPRPESAKTTRHHSDVTSLPKIASDVGPLRHAESTSVLPSHVRGRSSAITDENWNNSMVNSHLSPRPRSSVRSPRPMTPTEALKRYGHRLTPYEQGEILDYPEIWYLGLDSKKIQGTSNNANHGFDDENGSYIKVLNDHVAYRYEILEVIGKGSFGQVVRAFDHMTGEEVAIKMIRNKKRFHHQAAVEVKILDLLRRKDKENIYNIIHMSDHLVFRNHLCITFELMGSNLYEVIKKNNFQGFSLASIRRIAFSLLQCLRLLYRERIIHCDLKPENILLKSKSSTSIKVIDFGSSCYDHLRVYTYIQSRFYRSPEVILGLPYSMAIDMWSLGCILAEMYTGYPLFPGENELEQLACIMEIFGLPPGSLLQQATRRRFFFDSKGNPRCITNSKGKRRRPNTRDLASVLRVNDPHFVDFIRRCLEWEPGARLTPEEAIRHPFITQESSSRHGTPQTTPTQNRHHRSSTVSTASSSDNSHNSENSRSRDDISMRLRSKTRDRERLQPIGAPDPNYIIDESSRVHRMSMSSTSITSRGEPLEGEKFLPPIL
ncbi:PREDICTED: dual specificity tyrosine-phosphorylation-regulated kinase 4-like isoform X2 [Priapulus caudatus]|uniref:dual-specificity kinase n=1 Tax=Priapulus caudatus TaxID=37621 RepID=A0ABM1DSD7_PRICU|nr:PREDICTED: dual specificity tyrosine-phosphorylation-regulated kinase 4-like isoform X2 [Priapulus caudatus]